MSNLRYILSKLVVPLLVTTLGIVILVTGILNEQNIFVLLGGIGLIIAGLVIGIFMLQYERIPKLIFSILLILFIPAIALYLYFGFTSINDPIKFENEYQRRSEVVKKRLLNISNAQAAYRTVHKRYTGSFDTLIDFIKNGNLVLVKRINNTPLELQDQYSEQELIKRGYIIFDTIYTNVQDSIFKDVKDFNADNIKYIPFTHPKEVIKMDAGFIDRSNIKMPVFVAKAPKTKYLQDLDPDLIKNDKVIDLQVGSMNEPIRDGNWE